MNRLLSDGIATTIAVVQKFRIARVLALVFVSGFIVLTTAFYSGIAQAADNASLGERFRDRIERADQNSERPKTTGQFLDEARGNVPLGERTKNIIRDSKEAIDQFGKEYSVGAQESARNVKDKAAEAGRDLSRRADNVGR
jgi:hypothetical protein